MLGANDRLYLINSPSEDEALRMAVIGQGPADRWACTPNAPIRSRVRSTAVWTDEEVLVYGGVHDGPMSDGAAYDPIQRQWRVLPEAPLESVATPAAAAWTGDEFILWGSTDRTGIADPTGVAYDPGSDSWRTIRSAPIGLTDATSAWTGQELLVLGAALDDANRARTALVAIAYDPDSDTWRRLPDPPSLSPQAVAGTWVGEQFVAWDYALASAAYDPRTDAWEALPDLPLDHAECYPDASSVGGAAFASYCGQFAVLAEGRTWQEIPPPPKVDAGATSVAVGDDVYLPNGDRIIRYRLWPPASFAPADARMLVRLEAGEDQREVAFAAEDPGVFTQRISLEITPAIAPVAVTFMTADGATLHVFGGDYDSEDCETDANSSVCTVQFPILEAQRPDMWRARAARIGPTGPESIEVRITVRWERVPPR